MRTIVRDEGPLALYKGAVPALMLCTQGAVQFTVYEWLKARVPKQSENVRDEHILYFATSLASDTCCNKLEQYIFSPLQVLRVSFVFAVTYNVTQCQ